MRHQELEELLLKELRRSSKGAPAGALQELELKELEELKELHLNEL